MKEQFDPGLGTRTHSGAKRIIEPAGSFNVVLRGAGFSVRDIFNHLVRVSWQLFSFYVVAVFVLLNALFALFYVWTGIAGIAGATAGSFLHEFKQAFFFSVQTCATVGYGHMAPVSDWANVLAATETLGGLLGLSVVTGLLYSRFARPRPGLVYSKNALIAPYKDGSSFQFKVVNRRTDVLMDVEVRVILMLLTGEGEQLRREYYPLRVEISSIAFLPLTWTVVHPIAEGSPLFGKSEDELAGRGAEVIIQIKAFDESYSQSIYSRRSYVSGEWIWGARFRQSFGQGEDGRTVVFVDKIDDFDLVPAENL